ncbi:MAG TPA: hypothetical protein DCZ94_12210 [Lentisphaeria bacterium]|nr:MAG: hypothetical protein A2X48_12655 [Lentisphaerae bacterium GWF2_49_21]HBC87713.1 hypothetical protein [Lentisphaeria bacterium]
MEEAIVHSVKYRRKTAFFVFLFLVAMLLLGAVKVTAGLSERKSSRTSEMEKWTETVLRLSSEVPAENAVEWKELALKDPQLMLIANTSSFCQLDSSGNN